MTIERPESHQAFDGTSVRDLVVQEYWYLAPSRIHYEREDGPVSPYDFASVLHNTRAGRGFHKSLEFMHRGIPLLTRKTGPAHEAELGLERVRQEFYPELPTRLRCFFLSLSKEQAEKRAIYWSWENRVLTPCKIVKPAKTHVADVRIYESLARNGFVKEDAHRYWRGWGNGLPDDEFAEMLVDGDLFFLIG